jgi:hypothetical protein
MPYDYVFDYTGEIRPDRTELVRLRPFLFRNLVDLKLARPSYAIDHYQQHFQSRQTPRP